ncbi:MAG TPA: SDR family oxidoreductase [bacterium]|jgi:short-subunit dehydrogenase|nr:SDR family oxidoreductase [bacterium]
MAIPQDLKTALVTGASGGIGLEIARCLAWKKMDLVLVARRKDQLAALADDLTREHQIKVTVVAKDIAQPGAAQELHGELLAQGLEVDLLVNNAGLGFSSNFIDDDIAHDRQMIGLNISALTDLCKVFGKDMAARARGGILNVASTAAFQPGPGMAVYYASKAYVLNFSEALSYELKGKGVTVTCLCPGPTRTEFDTKAGMAGSKLFKSPLVQDASRVAEMGVEGFFAGKSLVFSSFPNWFLSFTVRFSPRGMVTALAAWMNG